MLHQIARKASDHEKNKGDGQRPKHRHVQVPEIGTQPFTTYWQFVCLGENDLKHACD